jgi:excisionase family DNA binding protein
MESDMDKLMLRVPEAAELLGLGRAKAYQLVQSGELPSIKIGRSVRIPVAALRAWVERQQREAGIDANNAPPAA